MLDIKSNPRFLPRAGEIVLFVRDLQPGNYAALDPQSKTFKIWNVEAQSFVGALRWEAGLVTQVPQEAITISDLAAEDIKQHSVHYSGYRIEPMSQVCTEEKSWSKRITYVPLHQIRPFAFYREILRKVDPRDYHATVTHALEIMSSFSLIERWHFKGTWPSATIYNRGLYIGSEMLMVGDVARLQALGDRNPNRVTDIMRITSVKTKLLHLDAGENPDLDSVDPTEDGAITQSRTYDVCVHVSGQAFTQDASRAWGTNKLPIDPKSGILPSGVAGYGDWYFLNDPSRRWEVPFHQVVGRCYEVEAMRKWFSSKVSTLPALSRFSAVNQGSPSLASADDQDEHYNLSDISTGLKGILNARKHSIKRDRRIDMAGGKSWFWADSRVEQLDLREINGMPVTDFTPGQVLRDPRAWNRALKIREKGPGFRSKLSKDEIQGYAQTAGQGANSTTTKHSSSMVANSAVGIEAADEEDGNDDDENESDDDGMDNIPARAKSATAQADEDSEMFDAQETLQPAIDVHSLAQRQPGVLRDSNSDSDDESEDANELMGRFRGTA